MNERASLIAARYQTGDQCIVCHHWFWETDSGWHSLVPLQYADHQDLGRDVVCPSDACQEVTGRPLSTPPLPRFEPVWWELRQAEHGAAMVGGRTWQEFVATCERRLGLPWARIREEFECIPAVHRDR